MKKITILVLLISVFSSSLSAQKLKKIFNGKNLDGWHLSNQDGTWTADKGILTIQSSAAKKGAILWTDKNYKNFIIEADYKNGEGTIDSGFFLRSDIDQIQIGISSSLHKDMTGSPYLPKLKYPVVANVDGILKDTDWNTMKIKVVGNTYTVWLNGKELVTYTSEGMPLEGPIGIQLHPGKEMSIFYKNIRLAEL